jgi:uncharacterized membrane protein YqjE
MLSGVACMSSSLIHVNILIMIILAFLFLAMGLFSLFTLIKTSYSDGYMDCITTIQEAMQKKEKDTA